MKAQSSSDGAISPIFHVMILMLYNLVDDDDDDVVDDDDVGTDDGGEVSANAVSVVDLTRLWLLSLLL